MTPRDTFKDQTFFLSQISKMALRRTMFPLANCLKCEVKQCAKELGLSFLVKKKESTGICFIGNRHFPDFISEYVEDNPGDFIDIDNGQLMGTHRGLHHWTVGQGCKLGGQLKPYFVADKEVATNIIYVAKGTDHFSLLSTELFTTSPHWIDEDQDILKKDSFRAMFRFQHTKPLVSCTVNKTGNGLRIHLDRPLRAVTPGQYAVLYNDNECLGSARISSRKLMHQKEENEIVEMPKKINV